MWPWEASDMAWNLISVPCSWQTEDGGVNLESLMCMGFLMFILGSFQNSQNPPTLVQMSICSGLAYCSSPVIKWSSCCHFHPSQIFVSHRNQNRHIKEQIQSMVSQNPYSTLQGQSAAQSGPVPFLSKPPRLCFSQNSLGFVISVLHCAKLLLTQEPLLTLFSLLGIFLLALICVLHSHPQTWLRSTHTQGFWLKCYCPGELSLTHLCVVRLGLPKVCPHTEHSELSIVTYYTWSYN